MGEENSKEEVEESSPILTTPVVVPNSHVVQPPFVNPITQNVEPHVFPPVTEQQVKKKLSDVEKKERARLKARMYYHQHKAKILAKKKAGRQAAKQKEPATSVEILAKSLADVSLEAT